jgi:hypothetical protein
MLEIAGRLPIDSDVARNGAGAAGAGTERDGSSALMAGPVPASAGLGSWGVYWLIGLFITPPPVCWLYAVLAG